MGSCTSILPTCAHGVERDKFTLLPLKEGSKEMIVIGEEMLYVIYIQGVTGGKGQIREGVSYVKLYRYNPKHLYPKLNGYGDNGKRSLKL